MFNTIGLAERIAFCHDMCFSINRELKLSAFYISDLRVRMVMHSTDCTLCEGVLDDHEII